MTAPVNVAGETATRASRQETTLALVRLADRIEAREVPLPALEAGMIRIDVESSLISPGSELGGWGAMKARQLKPPHGVPFGYSVAGTVAAKGPGTNGPAKGTRVVAIGAGQALHAQQVVVPAALVVPLPDSLSFDEGAYAMLLATAMHGVRRAEVTLGSRVMVAGMGVLGNLAAQLFRAAGCRVAAWDVSAAALQMARIVGFTECHDCSTDACIDTTRRWTRDEGLDVACWALGGRADDLWHRTINAMQISPDGHPCGRIVVLGHAEFTFQTRPMTNIDVVQASRTGPGYHDPAWERGAAYPPVFVRWDSRRNLELGLELVASGAVQVAPLTTHRLYIGDAGSALPAMLDAGDHPMGVVIRMKRS